MVASNYFHYLFLSSDLVDNVINASLECIEQKVTNEMNQCLITEVTLEEIKTYLFQMHPLKAPGLDGFTAGFY